MKVNVSTNPHWITTDKNVTKIMLIPITSGKHSKQHSQMSPKTFSGCFWYIEHNLDLKVDLQEQD